MFGLNKPKNTTVIIQMMNISSFILEMLLFSVIKQEVFQTID